MRFEDLARYDYALPPELIRKKGVEPRDSTRLFVYDTETDAVTHDFFYNLSNYLPERALMVLNETRVVPARLWLKKETGGKIEVFVLANEWSGDAENIPVLVDRKTLIGQRLSFPDGSFFEVVRQEESRFFVRLESRKSLNDLLDLYGETPVPHYLEEKEEIPRQARNDRVGEMGVREKEFRKRYQTVFARTGASVAAPTASLHFTDRVFASLDAKGMDIAKVTLDVGQGTFAPIREENFRTKKLHRERITVSEETAAKLNDSLDNPVTGPERSIIAVGTTALRTLESVVSIPVIPSESSSRGILTRQERSLDYARDDRKNVSIFRSYSGPTDIFIFPPHVFHSADILITNFHLPKTSLMLLVDAFLEWKGARRRILPLYEEAIREKYAFYSFGDSMLIL